MELSRYFTNKDTEFEYRARWHGTYAHAHGKQMTRGRILIVCCEDEWLTLTMRQINNLIHHVPRSKVLNSVNKKQNKHAEGRKDPCSLVVLPCLERDVAFRKSIVSGPD